MMKITIEDIKMLKEKTGAVMYDCKKALNEADGNQDEAIKILKTKGIPRCILRKPL